MMINFKKALTGTTSIIIFKISILTAKNMLLMTTITLKEKALPLEVVLEHTGMGVLSTPIPNTDQALSG